MIVWLFETFDTFWELDQSYRGNIFGYISPNRCYFLQILLLDKKKKLSNKKIFSWKITHKNTHSKLKYSKMGLREIFFGTPCIIRQTTHRQTFYWPWLARPGTYHLAFDQTRARSWYYNQTDHPTPPHPTRNFFDPGWPNLGSNI